MCAIEFDSKKFHNPGKHVIDTYILLHTLKKLSDFADPT